MPDFTKRVRYQDSVYYWNKETRRIAVVKDLDFKDCPAPVIEAMITAGEAGTFVLDEGAKDGRGGI